MRGRRSSLAPRARSAVLRAAALALGLSVLPAAAQDLDAGKSPARLFSGSCAACHRGPGGLGAGKDPRALADFLSQHYTSSRASAAALAGYLSGVGGDPRAARARTRAEPDEEHARPSPPGTTASRGTAEPEEDDKEAKARARKRRAEREQQRKEDERREERRKERAAALAAERAAVPPSRSGLPSVSSDPPPPIISLAPVPMPPRAAEAPGSNGAGSLAQAAEPGSTGTVPLSVPAPRGAEARPAANEEPAEPAAAMVPPPEPPVAATSER